MVSLVFTMAIALFGLVAGSLTKAGTLIGCNTNNTGLASAWNNLDSILQNVDSTLCTSNCRCGFTNPLLWANATYASSFAQWDNTGSNTAYQNCTPNAAIIAFQTNQAANGTQFNATLFASYWSVLETKFNCTGWCTTTYNNPNTPNSIIPVTMYKYMFTNINRYLKFF